MLSSNNVPRGLLCPAGSATRLWRSGWVSWPVGGGVLGREGQGRQAVSSDPFSSPDDLNIGGIIGGVLVVLTVLALIDQEKQNVVLWENKIEKFLAKPNKKKMLQRDNTGMKKGTWQMQYRFRICWRILQLTLCQYILYVSIVDNFPEDKWITKINSVWNRTHEQTNNQCRRWID